MAKNLDFFHIPST